MLKIETRQDGLVTILVLSGDLVIGEAETAFKRIASECLEDGRADLLLDCAELKMVDSTGLGVLVRMLTTSQNNGGQTKLLRPGSHLRRLLKMTQLDSVFECFDDAEAGVASF